MRDTFFTMHSKLPSEVVVRVNESAEIIEIKGLHRPGRKSGTALRLSSIAERRYSLEGKSDFSRISE